MEYKFKEDIILKVVKGYIDDTYSEHYANGKYQATDLIVDAGHGEGFCMGNIMKLVELAEDELELRATGIPKDIQIH